MVVFFTTISLCNKDMLDSTISQFREADTINGEEYVLLAYPNLRNVKIKTKNLFKSGVTIPKKVVMEAPINGNAYLRRNGEWMQFDNGNLVILDVWDSLARPTKEQINSTHLNQALKKYAKQDNTEDSPFSENSEKNGKMYCTQLFQTADATLCNIKGNVELSLSDIANTPIIRFTWKNPEDILKENQNTKEHIGTTAQHIRKVLPELITGDTGNMAVDYQATALAFAVLTAKHLEKANEKIKQLEDKIKELENKTSMIQ